MNTVVSIDTYYKSVMPKKNEWKRLRMSKVAARRSPTTSTTSCIREAVAEDASIMLVYIMVRIQQDHLGFELFF